MQPAADYADEIRILESIERSSASLPPSRQISIAAFHSPEKSAASAAHLASIGRDEDAHWLSTDAVDGQGAHRKLRVSTSELAQLYAELGTLEKSFSRLPKQLSFSRKESLIRRGTSVGRDAALPVS